MKEFRVARCLVNGKINEYAIFADGSRKKMIHTNDQYGKYFEVDNELNKECKKFLRFSYSGRIKDAVEMIRNGNGDCILSKNYFLGHVDKVGYFLDRENGERLRQTSLEGWKDTKFGWAIEYGSKNSLSGYSMINNKGERISIFSEDKTPMTFYTEDAANEYLDSLFRKSRYYAKKLVDNLKNVVDGKERSTIIDNVMNEIDKDTNTKFGVITDFVYDMLTDKCEPKSPNYRLDILGYRIVQIIIDN